MMFFTEFSTENGHFIVVHRSTHEEKYVVAIFDELFCRTSTKELF